MYNWHSSFYLFFLTVRTIFQGNLSKLFPICILLNPWYFVFIPQRYKKPQKDSHTDSRRRLHTSSVITPPLLLLGQSIFFLPLFLLPVNLPLSSSFLVDWRIFYSPSYTSASVPPAVGTIHSQCLAPAPPTLFPHFSPCSICPDLFPNLLFIHILKIFKN